MHRPTPRVGFTLLEMTIVLTILAVLTGLAISLMEGTVDQARFEVTQRQLQTINDAILGPTGQPDAMSFVADVGRLPLVGTNPDDPLYELTASTLPAGLLPFGAHSPTQDSDVSLFCGWRGPYVSPPQGPTGMRDGWGQPYTATTQTTAWGVVLLNLTSVGGPSSPYQGQTLSLPTPLVPAAWSGTLSGNLLVHSPTGTAPAALSVRLFVPDAAAGVRVLTPSGSDLAPTAGTTVSYPFSFTDVPAGVVALRAYRGAGTDKTEPPSNVMYVKMIPRGTPTREIHLYIP